MTAPTEKAAPIPAEVLALADATAKTAWKSYGKGDLKALIARAIMQDRADRQEERIREDERAACATVAECAFDDRPRLPDNIDWTDGYRDGTRDAAQAIRARQRGDVS